MRKKEAMPTFVPVGKNVLVIVAGLVANDLRGVHGGVGELVAASGHLLHVAVFEEYVHVHAEYDRDHQADEHVDADGPRAHTRLPVVRVDDHDTVDADEREQPRAELECAEGEEAYPAAPEQVDLLEVVVGRRLAQMVLEEGVHVPLVQHGGVRERQYGQDAEARVLFEVLALHDQERGHVEDGAYDDQKERVVGDDEFVRIVDVVPPVQRKVLVVQVLTLTTRSSSNSTCVCALCAREKFVYTYRVKTERVVVTFCILHFVVFKIFFQMIVTLF